MSNEQLTPEEVEAMKLGQVPPGAEPPMPSIETRSAAQVGDINTSERIITVIAVPYEQATRVPFQREVWNEIFTRSAFDGFDPARRRIPATACLEVPAPNHGGGKIVGRVVKVYPERTEGLIADLKISETDDGDKTLALARDDALSLSVGFMVKNRLDETLDRPSRTRRINRAFLDHIAFVGQPAYEGTKVLAMRDGSLDEDETVSATPNLDKFLSDPAFDWSNLNIRR
jgi:phage head maturation protease